MLHYNAKNMIKKMQSPYESNKRKRRQKHQLTSKDLKKKPFTDVDSTITRSTNK